MTFPIVTPIQITGYVVVGLIFLGLFMLYDEELENLNTRSDNDVHSTHKEQDLPESKS